jgi:hypothetical protein
MARNRAFLHIGLAKTGTKSIQFALARRRSRLLQGGWIFPTQGTTTNRSGHHALAWRLQGDSHLHPALRRFDLDAFKQLVANSAEQNLIVSSEELAALSREADIRALLDIFQTHDVFVIAYIREQAEFMNSFYAQILEELDYTQTIDQFVAKEIDSFNYGRWLSNWKEILGHRFIVRPFDPMEFPSGDVVHDFAQVLGIEDLLKPLSGIRENTHNNPLQTAVLLGFSRLLADRGEHWERYSPKHRQLRAVVTSILEDPELKSQETYWGLDAELVARIRDHYAESNREFFLSTLGRTFEFSSHRSHRKQQSVCYEDLPQELRTKLERKLLEALSNNESSAEAAPANLSASEQ